MKHLGDITKISGRDAPTVNVIIGGSPCQDLSIAGKRAGLGGQRSGLFMEQIRIIKEMRKKDAESGRTGANIRPRFMVWENVPGAFSVNGGRDFAAVLEETIRVVDEEAPDILPPAKGWTNSGCYMGDRWSVAWRVLDAQFWGVPQRRRRIALVADFGGECAPEILFERESVSRHFESCEAARQRTAGDAANSTGTAISFLERAGCAGGGKGILIQDDQTGTLSTVNNQAVCFCPQMGSKAYGIGYAEEQSPTLRTTNDSAVCYGICSDKSNSMLSGNPHSGIYEADTSRTLDNNCGNPACNQGGIAVVEQETASGVQCLNPYDSQSARVYDANGVWHSLNANSNGGQSRDAVVCLQGNGIDRSDNAGCAGRGWTDGNCYTLNTVDRPAVCYAKTTRPHSKDEAPTIEKDENHESE